MAIRLRPIEPADYDVAGRLLIDSYPHRTNELPLGRRPESKAATLRWVADDDGEMTLTGYAALWNVEHRKYRFDVIVDRCRRGRGIGTQLFDLVLREARRAGGPTLQARAYVECADAIGFLERRGFMETMRMHGFVLDLLEVDDRAWSRWAHSTVVDDIAVAPVSPSEVDDGRFWRRLCELHDAATEGWPDPDPDGSRDPVSEGELRQMLLGSGRPPVAFLIGRRGQELVAYSVLAPRTQPADEAQFAATAVRPDYRRRGIATRLRARCLAAARAAGFRTVRSASGHPALLRTNRRFGFEERYCEVRLVKRVG
jgi:GNAT superfamily N-acetyltransferase